MAMDELAKANHSVMKMGGDAVACEATLKQLEEDLVKWKDWANKATNRVSELEKEGNKQRVEIAKLKKETSDSDQAKELEVFRAEVDSLKE